MLSLVLVPSTGRVPAVRDLISDAKEQAAQGHRPAPAEPQPSREPSAPNGDSVRG
jgi:hypothetical protein